MFPLQYHYNIWWIVVGTVQYRKQCKVHFKPVQQWQLHNLNWQPWAVQNRKVKNWAQPCVESNIECCPVTSVMRHSQPRSTEHSDTSQPGCVLCTVTVYTMQCTVYSNMYIIYFTVYSYSVQHTVYCIQLQCASHSVLYTGTVYIIQCIVYSYSVYHTVYCIQVQCTSYCVLYTATVCIIQCIVYRYSVHYTVYCIQIQCTLYSILCKVTVNSCSGSCKALL